ncbi:MAG: hypothetical protein OSJ65_05940 [Bacilli bacterium]|nr:hypothetical protein [Bacilli bacterium]
MKNIYKKARKIKYNNSIFQIIIRDDYKIGFFKIVNIDEKEILTLPTAKEFLHLSSVLNVKNGIKF